MQYRWMDKRGNLEMDLICADVIDHHHTDIQYTCKLHVRMN